MRRSILYLLMMPCLASAISTPQIINSSLSPDCLEYRVTGICYWLFCTPFGCSVRTSVKVRYYRPDHVISAYSCTGHNPWSEMAPLSPPLPPDASDGGDTHPRSAYQHSKLRFKNADAIGHPGGEVFNQFLETFGTSCPGSSRPFQPYFLSQLDTLAWRHGIPEKFYPESLTPGVRELGADGAVWGNIYPRTGAVVQTCDYKAAAVVAQRVADIITRDGQPHVYLPATAEPHDGYWPPAPVQEGKHGNHKWQMLVPQLSSQCAIFPNGSPADSFADQLASDGGYAWALWRPYSCCKKRGQIFLGSTGE